MHECQTADIPPCGSISRFIRNAASIAPRLRSSRLGHQSCLCHNLIVSAEHAIVNSRS